MIAHKCKYVEKNRGWGKQEKKLSTAASAAAQFNTKHYLNIISFGLHFSCIIWISIVFDCISAGLSAFSCRRLKIVLQIVDFILFFFFFFLSSSFVIITIFCATIQHQYIIHIYGLNVANAGIKKSSKF